MLEGNCIVRSGEKGPPLFNNYKSTKYLIMLKNCTNIRHGQSIHVQRVKKGFY